MSKNPDMIQLLIMTQSDLKQLLIQHTEINKKLYKGLIPLQLLRLIYYLKKAPLTIRSAIKLQKNFSEPEPQLSKTQVNFFSEILVDLDQDEAHFQ